MYAASAFAAPCLAGEEAAPVDNGAGEKKLVDLFGDIARNMELIEEMLKKKESGPPCQSSQQEVDEKLDALVKELMKRQCSPSGGGGGDRMQKQSQGEGEKQKDEGAEKLRQEAERQEGRMPRNSKPQERGEKESQGKVPNIRRALETPPPSGIAGPLGEKQGTSGWGFLPGEVRALLDASGRSGVPAKYAEMIRRYYERLSEDKKTK